MDFLTPPMFDASNINMWKFKMRSYFKAQELDVYLVTTKKSYFGNDKYLEANTQALGALKHTLSKKFLSLISHCNSAFTVWNIDFSQRTNDKRLEEGIHWR